MRDALPRKQSGIPVICHHQAQQISGWRAEIMLWSVLLLNICSGTSGAASIFHLSSIGMEGRSQRKAEPWLGTARPKPSLATWDVSSQRFLPPHTRSCFTKAPKVAEEDADAPTCWLGCWCPIPGGTQAGSLLMTIQAGLILVSAVQRAGAAGAARAAKAEAWGKSGAALLRLQSS